jgi:hypothetical protein
MKAPCPRCGEHLRVDKAPKAHGLALCPFASCGATLVVTAERLPFDPEKHGFTLRDWEAYRGEADKTERVGIVERLVARIVPAAACGLLTGVAAALLAANLVPEAPVGLVFAVAVPTSTLAYAALLGELYARDKRAIVGAMRFMNERLQRDGPSIRLRPAEKS